MLPVASQQQRLDAATRSDSLNSGWTLIVAESLQSCDLIQPDTGGLGRSKLFMRPSLADLRPAFRRSFSRNCATWIEENLGI